MIERSRGRSSCSLLQAVALASLANLVALAGSACGKVVVDAHLTSAGSGGSSGSGGAGGSTSTGTGGALDAGDAGCNPDVTPPGVPMLACFQSGYCPAPYTQSAMEQIDVALALCDTAMHACCGEPVIQQVVCGPSPAGIGGCCYTVFVAPLDCAGG